MGGDGITGAVAGELQATARALLAVLPGGRGNDFARKLGIPFEPAEAAKLLADRRTSGGSTSPRPTDTTYLGILSAGHRLRRQPDRARDAAEARHVRLHLRRAARDLLGWSAADWDVTDRRRDARVRGLLASRSATPACSAAGCTWRPDAKLDDGLLDVVLIARQSKRAYLRGLPRVFKGTHLQDPAIKLLQGREVTFSADRPFTAYADGDPIVELPATVAGAAGRAAGGGAAMMRLAAGVAAAKAVGTLARTAGRGGGTSLPGQGAHARRAARDRPARAAPGPRQRRDLAPPTARRPPRRWSPRSWSAPARGSSTTAPGRTWRAGSPPRSPAPRAGAGAG